VHLGFLHLWHCFCIGFQFELSPEPHTTPYLKRTSIPNWGFNPASCPNWAPRNQMLTKWNLFHWDELWRITDTLYKSSLFSCPPRLVYYPHSLPCWWQANHICTLFPVLPFVHSYTLAIIRVWMHCWLFICPVKFSFVFICPVSMLACPLSWLFIHTPRPHPRPFHTHKRMPVICSHDPEASEKQKNPWGPFASPLALRHITIHSRQTPTAAGA
jgi:hypothetical protein